MTHTRYTKVVDAIWLVMGVAIIIWMLVTSCVMASLVARKLLEGA